jgi:hypothetical protein
MPERRRSTTKESKQHRQHIEELTNFFVERGLKLSNARALATELISDPPPEVRAGMMHVAWKARNRKILPVNDERHGLNGYNNYACRCDICKEAQRVDITVRRARRQAAGLPDGDERHGTYNGYSNYCCRCDHCKLAARDRVVGRTT